ncbi:LKAM1-like protein [Mya arenaria]|uniref:LKAM1-like protein n=1 Tax=Mya arenaria TaxID=6604 RepID=A0ABY7F242_MYAAR|nr:LKAM1-like protein [Mya arenaria]WAR16502.1 LKAM1-like protein [Mya arenaria]
MADDDGGKFKVRNKKKITERDLKKMAPQQRSKDNAPPSDEQIVEREKHEKLIGQLKAAEARNRLRIMRLRYQSSRAQEIGHLIACQPTALKAVRLQALVPSYPNEKDRGDSLEKLDRERIEALLEDNKGLLINRIN